MSDQLSEPLSQSETQNIQPLTKQKAQELSYLDKAALALGKKTQYSPF